MSRKHDKRPPSKEEEEEDEEETLVSSCSAGQDSAVNPFASFAFGGATAASAPAPPSRSSTTTSAGPKRKRGDVIVDAAAAVNRPLAIETKTDNKQQKKKKKKEMKKREGCKAEGIGEYTAEELRQLRGRWRSMADRDAAVEDQYFQVLVGAILSSRAQGSVVDEGLSRLRARKRGLTAAAMTDIDQESLADILRHVHWNKAKAKHIRESAAMIVRRHRGKVPRRKRDLLALPGVGPALVEILVNVFDSWEADDAAARAAAEARMLPTAGGGGGGGGCDIGGNIIDNDGGGGGGCDVGGNIIDNDGGGGGGGGGGGDFGGNVTDGGGGGGGGGSGSGSAGGGDDVGGTIDNGGVVVAITTRTPD